MPVDASNGASSTRKSCCSCAVHSAQTVTAPPIFALEEPELDDVAGVDEEPHAVAIPRTPAVTTASLLSVLTCVIEVLLTGAKPSPSPRRSKCVMHRCTPPVLETQLPQIGFHTNG